jgi:hypothetical protein
MTIIVPNYKITEFDQTNGVITIWFQNESPYLRPAPIIDGAYLVGLDLDVWVKSLYVVRKTITSGLDYSTITNADALLSIVDTTPFP